jgi:hypothetical protein
MQCQFLHHFLSCAVNKQKQIGFEVLTAVGMKSSTSTFHLLFIPVSCSANSLTLKMEATCSSETLDDFQWTTWRYIPEGSTLQKQVLQLYRILNFSYNVLIFMAIFSMNKTTLTSKALNITVLHSTYVQIQECFSFKTLKEAITVSRKSNG